MDVHTYRAALPDALAAALRDEGPALGALPNHWLPAAELCKPPAQRELRTLAEECVASVYDRVVAARLPSGWAASGGGVEWWCQHRGNEGMSFHIDKDELLMKSVRTTPTYPPHSSVASASSESDFALPTTYGTAVSSDEPPYAYMLQGGAMSTPTLSSILYLNHVSSAAEGDAASRPGPTLICAQGWDQSQGCLAPAVPQRSALLFPAFGRLALFQGDLAHGVLQSGFEGKRLTFLMNWWAAPPKDIRRPTPEEVISRGLSPAGCGGPPPATTADEDAAAVVDDELAAAAAAEPRWWIDAPDGINSSSSIVAIRSLSCSALDEAPILATAVTAADAGGAGMRSVASPADEAAAQRARRVAELAARGTDSRGDNDDDPTEEISPSEGKQAEGAGGGGGNRPDRASWAAVLEAGGPIIVDHSGFVVYQTPPPHYEVVLLSVS